MIALFVSFISTWVESTNWDWPSFTHLTVSMFDFLSRTSRFTCNNKTIFYEASFYNFFFQIMGHVFFNG